MAKRLIKNLDKLSERTYEINLVEEKDVAQEISDTLIEYLNKHSNAVAVTSNQFGYNKRAFAVRFSDEGIKVYFNPIFMKQEGMHIALETNVSLPNRQFLMPRSDKTILAYQNLFGVSQEATFEGIVSEIIQQQVQLLDGMIISDIGLEVFDDFMSASEEDQQEVVEYYIESLKEQTEEINNEIETDPELKKRSDAIKFLTAAAKGEVKLYKEEKPQLSNRKKKLLHKLAVKAKNINRRFTKKKHK